jgi:hypothetical protein
MVMGILYLIQPVEYIGTDCYKIGYSSKSNIDRVRHGYKKGTRYLHIVECDNAIEIEKILIDVFNENFTLFAGREYFKGDINEMLDVFYNVYKKNKNTETTNKIQESVYQEKCDKQYDCDDEECEEEEECDDEECEELTDKDNESIKEVKTIEDIKHSQKCNTKFFCEKCNYYANRKTDLLKHFKRKKHMEDKQISDNSKKSNTKFFCEKCNYYANRKTDLLKHFKSKKHMEEKKIEKKEFKCEFCNKIYKFRQGLYSHKKKCKKDTDIKEDNQNINGYKDVIIKLINEKSALHDLLIKQQENFIKQQEETNKKFENLILHINPNNN